ncbi:glycosyltransferase family 2 protein [Halomonas korlensis]|uniref:Glycosyl transferase family 2 n=1 Tax=Halomonas korlensis TaxID=463301 RepID=A0A1I7KDN7_9GAMM|nr:glycosyltransferase [Halomonas korlensis]SFU95525.1 Glycosyl transferase family 2 [Halomonas korlensis]
MEYDITVITPVYNGEDYIRKCIESVLNQDGVKVQHIVVDDGSVDGSYEAARGYNCVSLIKQKNAGAPSARNLGLTKALGNYIKFLDADDYLLPGCLEKQFHAAEMNEGKVINYGFRDIVWEHRRICKRKTLRANLDDAVASGSLPQQVSRRISKNLMTSLPLYPAKAIKKVGGFDLRLMSSQEWNLNIRLAIAGYRFMFDDVHCYTQRIHDSPSRITNRKCDPKSELLNDKYTYESVESLLEHQCVRDAWAKRLRGKASNFIMAGFIEEGQRMLDEATLLSGHSVVSNIYGYPYRTLGSLFSGVSAARLHGLLIKSARKILYRK